MASESNKDGNYDLRRKARGGTPRRKKRRWMQRIVWGVGGVLICALIGLSVFLWFSFCTVRTVSARVQASVAALSSKVDARLLEVYVKEKQQVSKGERLARLDDSELVAALEAARADHLIRRSRLAEAQAQCTLVSAQVEADIHMAEAQLAVAKAQVTAAQAVIDLRVARLAAEAQQAKAQAEEARATLKQVKAGTRKELVQAAEARVATAKALQALYALEVRQSEALVVDGIHSQHQLEERKTRLTMQENAVREAELELARLRAGATPDEIEAAAQGLAAREAGLALVMASEKELDALRADLTIRKAEQTEAEARLKQAQAKRTAVAIAQEKTRAAEAEITKSDAEIRGRAAALESMEIISPVSGTVTRVFDDVGEVCRKGVPCILVSDDSKPRWIEGFVREEDAMLVEAGQAAQVRVPAGSGSYVDAVVEQVSLHTQSLERGTVDLGGASLRTTQADRVWVRIRPLAPLEGTPVTGTTARAIIWIRQGLGARR